METLPVKSQEHGSRLSYTVGFISSLVLTIIAYILVTAQVLSGTMLMVAIVGLALVQLLVQLLFFLHLNREDKPRWNLLVFSFMALVLAIIVIGSLWIMHNLDYNMMSQEQMDTYMHQQKDKGF